MAKDYEVATERDIVFAEHDGVKLLADLYLPKGLGKAPVLVGVHGGAGRSATASSIRTGEITSPETARPCLRSSTG
jgi:predicted acyl esterase